ncbi:MAG: arylamine N-acetyltransferase [Phycisphaerales bacterium]
MTRTSDQPSEFLVDRVLARLGFTARPQPDLSGLKALYGAWCRHVPFDNVRKIVHLRGSTPGPLPGTSAADFFEAWLTHGTGGTCWAGNGALERLLVALGFDARRGIGTMMAAPNLPPNHGLVTVRLDGVDHLVDASILHGEPLPLANGSPTRIEHPAWGVECRRDGERWNVHWRPLHQLGGFVCRIEQLTSEPGEFAERYERTRGWSPFNYELHIRRNREAGCVGLVFGKRVEIDADGRATERAIDDFQRRRLLVEELGVSEEMATAIPADVPTPPPPGSRAAGVSPQ